MVVVQRRRRLRRVRGRTLSAFVVVLAMVGVLILVFYGTTQTQRLLPAPRNQQRLLPPLSRSVIDRANATDVTIRTTDARPAVPEASAVNTAAGHIPSGQMFPVAASVVTLTTGNETSAQTVWAVESKPDPGVIVAPPGGASSPVAGETTEATTAPGVRSEVLFRLDFVGAQTGTWLWSLGIVGRVRTATPTPRTVAARWTRLSSSTGALPPGSQVTSVVTFEGRLMAAGLYFPGKDHSLVPGCAQACEPVVWTSTDGKRWTTAWNTGTVTLGSDTSQHLVVMGHEVLLFDSGTGGTVLWRSTDGVSWRRVHIPDAMGALTAGGVVSGHGRLVAIFSNKFAGGPDTAYGNGDTVWTSTDGVTWHQSQITGESVIDSVTATATGFLLGGESSSHHEPTVWSSSDAMTWTGATVGSGQPGPFVAANSSTSVAFDIATSNSSPMWWSRNAGIWTPASVPPGFPMDSVPLYPVTLLPAPQGFFASDGPAPMLWFSPTGASWSLVTSTGAPLSSKAQLAGVFVDRQGLLAVANGRSPAFWQITLSAAG
jgi:hypothetical protein